MKKDVIYIDVEDDITAIIDKVKSSKEKLVALVLPKRAGVLQSAVNLRLLDRSAKSGGKSLVLVTSNKSLVALAASTSIPVAKNLQSKPEIPDSPLGEADDIEDVIDGTQLPVGELAKTAPGADKSDLDDAVDTIDIDPVADDYDGDKKPKSSKKAIKIPDFSGFRKKLFIGGAGLVGLTALLIWAFGFAPAATVIITARTSPAPVSMNVVLGGTQTSDVSKNIIQTVPKQIVEEASVEFEATGEKDAGERAKGSITIRNCDYAGGFTLPAGTSFTSSNGRVFENSVAVSVPGFTSPTSSGCSLSGGSSGKATVEVLANAPGESYNISATSYAISSMSGQKVDAVGTAMTGGTTKIVKIVTAADVQKAGENLVQDIDENEVKAELTSQFANSEVVIADSFVVEKAPAKASPDIGDEVGDSKPKLTSKITYSLVAIAQSELKLFLKEAIGKQIDSSKQQIYDDGIDEIRLSGYDRKEEGDKITETVNLSAIGRVGPVIQEDLVKEQAKDKRYGEVQSQLERLDGVVDVDVKFSYFWVRTVPSDVAKIKVEFAVEDE